MATDNDARTSGSNRDDAKENLPTVLDQAKGETDLSIPIGGVYTPNLIEPGDTPPAGDVDPDTTASAEATGQGGDTEEPKKRKAFAWS